MKKPSRVKIGANTEQLAAQRLTDQGYRVWMPNKARFGKTGKFRSNDVFEVFDILALKDGILRMIQIRKAAAFSTIVSEKIKSLGKITRITKEYHRYHKDEWRIKDLS